GPAARPEGVQRAVGERRFELGQGALSRDIHDLHLVKTGTGYARPQDDTGSELPLPPVSRLVREFVLEVRPAENLLVIKTTVGSAQPVAAALDGEDWPEALGTIAGDDTILIVCPQKKASDRIVSRIQEM